MLRCAHDVVRVDADFCQTDTAVEAAYRQAVHIHPGHISVRLDARRAFVDPTPDTPPFPDKFGFKIQVLLVNGSLSFLLAVSVMQTPGEVKEISILFGTEIVVNPVVTARVVLP
jgi:hypothetical protein